MLTACQTPPKGLACVAFTKKGFNLCYDMTKDFDENGDPKPEAKGQRFPIADVHYFDRRVNFDPDSYASLKAFALKQKAKCEAKNVTLDAFSWEDSENTREENGHRPEVDGSSSR